MRVSFYVKLFFILLLLTLHPLGAYALSPTVTIDDFISQSGQPSVEFKITLEKALTEAGLNCSNGTDGESQTRYRLSGLVDKNEKDTSFSAILSDNFHLEPEVFIKGKQLGGQTTEPAAEHLAKSVFGLISNQSIASIEVLGYSRLTPNAVMALAQILPGETVTPQKIIAARILLENCGLFEKVQLSLTPGIEGRKVKIDVKENDWMITATMPGPGKAVLENILGPSTTPLPEFPQISPPVTNSSSTGFLAYKAENIITRFRNNDGFHPTEDFRELVRTAAAIRNRITSHDKSCRDMCIILMKLCSMLDSKTVKAITEELQSGMDLNTDQPENIEKTLSRIELINQAYSAAQESQLILASRIYHDRIHSPVIPWVLFSLGEQALKAEDITRAAPLLNGAIALSSLPVAPELLVTTAKAQFSNLDYVAGNSAAAMIKPLLADPGLDFELREQIRDLTRWAALCETATAITEEENFDLQLQKGNALILLDRPDLAEALFHRLHSLKPRDARPLTGFARLAFQRTGSLLSVRPYLERAERMDHKDRFFYELALAYKLERITKEALPTIQLEGRNSEEASATRFLLPKASEYAQEYRQFNKPQAALLLSGINVLDEWLSYPSMTTGQALENMFKQTESLRDEMPDEKEIISANLFFSRNATNREAARRLLTRPMFGKKELGTHFLQLNLLIREMTLAPTEEIAAALQLTAQNTFSNAENRGEAVALQADAQAVAGLFHNSTTQLERAKSLYDLAVGLSDRDDEARLLNNLACVNLALGQKSEADDLYDEAMDSGPAIKPAVELGKIISSLPDNEREQALLNLAATDIPEKIRAAALSLNMIPKEERASTQTNSTEEHDITENNSAGMSEVYLDELDRIEAEYDNYTGLQMLFKYNSNIWLLPTSIR